MIRDDKIPLGNNDDVDANDDDDDELESFISLSAASGVSFSSFEIEASTSVVTLDFLYDTETVS